MYEYRHISGGDADHVVRQLNQLEPELELVTILLDAENLQYVAFVRKPK